MNRINSVNFNAPTLKLAEKFDHPFLRLFLFRNIFALDHGLSKSMIVFNILRAIAP